MLESCNKALEEASKTIEDLLTAVQVRRDESKANDNQLAEIRRAYVSEMIAQENELKSQIEIREQANSELFDEREYLKSEVKKLTEKLIESQSERIKVAQAKDYLTAELVKANETMRSW